MQLELPHQKSLHSQVLETPLLVPVQFGHVLVPPLAALTGEEVNGLSLIPGPPLVPLEMLGLHGMPAQPLLLVTVLDLALLLAFLHV